MKTCVTKGSTSSIRTSRRHDVGRVRRIRNGWSRRERFWCSDCTLRTRTKAKPMKSDTTRGMNYRTLTKNQLFLLTTRARLT